MNAAKRERHDPVTAGLTVFRVGGWVRDGLLGLPQKESDWVVTQASKKIMEERGFIRVGHDFPVFIHPHSKEEYALARRETKKGRGYHGFSCDTSGGLSIEEDLLRRDLTINAMARDQNGRLIDPWGGQRDLEKKLLRHVSDAFKEDPLRIVRTARFAARLSHLGFSVAEETMELMRGMVADGEASALKTERVWLEFNKAMRERNPSVFFQVLTKVTMLEVFAPQLARLFKSPDSKRAISQAIDQAAARGQPVFGALALMCSYCGYPLLRLCADMKSAVRERKTAQHADALIQAIKLDQTDAETILSFLEKADAFRNPRRLTASLKTLECCASFIDNGGKWTGLLGEALQKLQKINPGLIAGQCGKRSEIEGAIRAARLKALSDKQDKDKGAER